jgi:N-acetylmuramic acid 6-phosphate etherase
VNTKLTDRARRIVQRAADVTREEAARLLDEAHGNVKAAILMARLGVDRTEAERRLGAAQGRLSEALSDG